MNTTMKVIKRNGQSEEVSFDKVTSRLRYLCQMEPKLRIDPIYISQKVCSQIFNGVSTSDLDELSAQTCTSNITVHPDYGLLASRLIISNNHKLTSPSFSETIYLLYNNRDNHNKQCPLVSTDLFKTVMTNKDKLNSCIKYDRDYAFDYFGFKTLEKAYLIKVNGKIVERIQHLFMRVSLGIHGNNIKMALETYDAMSQKYFIHATPTLFHSGTTRPQLLSCFLMGIGDSVDGIYKTISDCAKISKWAGGVGIWAHDIRATNSIIRSTNGKSNGLIPMLRVFNETARHINQSGKRNGSFAIYLEPWHADILEFLEAKKNHGDENARARDLFYALWLPDLFMKRVKEDGNWSLMCPDTCRYLSDSYGEKFEQLYLSYEKDDTKVRNVIKARTLWEKILISQIETGTPYLLYKDACNLKSNQQNLGTIRSSNLCTEIIEYSDDKEYACCTLASIGLPKYVVPFDNKSIKSVEIYTKSTCKFCRYAKNLLNSKNINFKEVNLDENNIRDKFFEEINKEREEPLTTVPQIMINGKYIGGFNDLYNYFKPTLDYKTLMNNTRIITRNLNHVIDINYYPIEETKVSNFRHRPIGIGVQGLADVYALFKCSFDSSEAKEINKKIFAAIYYASMSESMVLSKNNRPYSTFENSPVSKGIFQFDLWGQQPVNYVGDIELNWTDLKNDVQRYGVRNSLLLAPMPTASTSQILGNNECIEPFTSNIYSRSTLAGTFIVVNKHLLNDLIDIQIWQPSIKDDIIKNGGSIQNIDIIPDVIKDIYKTSWDLSQKSLIDQAADRGIYICQSQSLNLYMKNPDLSKLSSMHMYTWSKGLKTGIYYLRTKAVAKAQQFTIEPERNDGCEMCSA
jgi:ribonucleoside-diphosphate reductase alpha subunit